MAAGSHEGALTTKKFKEHFGVKKMLSLDCSDVYTDIGIGQNLFN